MKEKGMKSARMPQEYKEKDEGQLNPVCKLKYSGEMSAPSDYDKNSAGLADYVKKNRMKY